MNQTLKELVRGAELGQAPSAAARTVMRTMLLATLEVAGLHQQSVTPDAAKAADALAGSCVYSFRQAAEHVTSQLEARTFLCYLVSMMAPTWILSYSDIIVLAQFANRVLSMEDGPEKEIPF